MTTLQRMKSNAELAAGRRDGAVVHYERFNEDEWNSSMAAHKPTELFRRTTAYEVAPQPKELANQLLLLIAHLTETATDLTDLVMALPVHDAPGRILKAEILTAIRDLTEGLE
jgi:hypothetical protein